MTLMRGGLALALILCLPGISVCAPADTALPQPHFTCAVQPAGGKWSATAPWIAGLSENAFSSALTPEQHTTWGEF
jgi:hypothetical protein